MRLFTSFFLWIALSWSSFAETASISISAPNFGSGTTTLNYSTVTRSFNFSGRFDGVSGSGSSNYSINNANRITITAFNLSTGISTTLPVPSFVMNRSGSSYSGSFFSSLLNGTVSVSIDDENDSDRDGIPNLSDLFFNPPPSFSISEGEHYFARATNGLDFSWQAIASNATSYSLTPALPAGLTISAQGRITGTPRAPGTHWFTLTASNSAGTDERHLVLYVLPPSKSLPFEDSFATNSLGLYLILSSSLAHHLFPTSRFLSYSVTGRRLEYTARADSSATEFGNFIKADLNLLLSLSSDWEVSVDVNLPQPSLIKDGVPYQGLGMGLVPHDPAADLSPDADVLSLEMGHGTLPQESLDGNADRNTIWFFARDEWDQVVLQGREVPASNSRASLRLSYHPVSRQLFSFYRANASTAWIPVATNSLNPLSAGSIAQRWGLQPASSLRLFLWADSFQSNGVAAGQMWFDNFSVSRAPVSITSSNAASGVVNAPFTYQAAASVTPSRFNLAGTLPAGLVFGSTNGRITGTPSQAGIFSVSLSATVSNVTGPLLPLTITIAKAKPVITWSNPAAITYGTALSATQLRATSSVAGTYTYTPAIRTVLNAGTHSLRVVFATTNPNFVSPVTNTVGLVVNKANPVITNRPTASAITFGQALSNSVLSGGSNSLAGTWSWVTPTNKPARGTNLQSVRFTPTASNNYNSVITNISVRVN